MTDENLATLQNRFSLAEQIACVDREIKMRKRVYPRFVSDGRMSQDVADRELACMEQVARTLRALIDDRK